MTVRKSWGVIEWSAFAVLVSVLAGGLWWVVSEMAQFQPLPDKVAKIERDVAYIKEHMPERQEYQDESYSTNETALVSVSKLASRKGQ